MIRARYRATNTTVQAYSAGNAFTDLLDLFPNAAAAYSLRKLRTAYSGSAVRVRRSSDSTEQDIGFTTEGELDTTSLLSFVNEDVVKYQSDFTTGSEDLSEFNGVGSDGETIDGVSDAYKFTLTSNVEQVYEVRLPNPINNGCDAIISLEFYIPSTNSVVDGIELRDFGGGNKLQNNTTDAWTSIELNVSNTTNGNIRILAIDSTDISPANANNDVFYLKNIVVTQTTADGLVSAWYDQSLTNDATQGAGANQPKIVSGGSLVADVNGKPALSLDGVNNFMTLTLQLSTPLSLFAVINEDGTNSFPYVFGNSVGSLDDILALGFIKSGTEVRNFISGTNAYTDANYTGRHLWTSIMDSSNSYLGKDGVLGTATNNVTGTSIRTQLNLFRSTAAITTMSGTAQELILYGSNQSANRTGIETNINTFYAVYPDFSVSGLLHDYPNAAAAYSVRQLTIYNNGYKEKLIKIRRSSGGETDVFADDSYELSLNSRVSAGGTLGDWIGSDDGFVVTWYDQSSNENDATQAATGSQPLIVSSGSMVEENGKPAINFDGVDDYFGFTSLALDDMIISSVQKIDTDASAIYNGASDYFRSRIGSYRTRINLATIDFLGATIQQQTLLSFQRVGSTLDLFEDGVSLGSGSNSSTFNIDEIGGDAVSFVFQGNLQELIFYSSDQSSNRTGIETNINTFYSIYP